MTATCRTPSCGNDVTNNGNGCNEIWRWCQQHAWTQLDAPADARGHTLRVRGDEVLIAGNYSAHSEGQLWWLQQERWQPIEHSFGVQTWIRIEIWRDRFFLVAEQGGLFEFIDAGQPRIIQIGPTDFHANWLSCNAAALHAIGGNIVLAFDGNTWRDVPLPPSVTQL